LASISATATFSPAWPNSSAVARPMPAPPPVISATLPARPNIEVSSFMLFRSSPWSRLRIVRILNLL
jgi:hypothetical protein